MANAAIYSCPMPVDRVRNHHQDKPRATPGLLRSGTSSGQKQANRIARFQLMFELEALADYIPQQLPTFSAPLNTWKEDWDSALSRLKSLRRWRHGQAKFEVPYSRRRPNADATWTGAGCLVMLVRDRELSVGPLTQ